MSERRRLVHDFGFDPCDLFRELKNRKSLWMWRCSRMAVHPLENPAFKRRPRAPVKTPSLRSPQREKSHDRGWEPKDTPYGEQARWPIAGTDESRPEDTRRRADLHPWLTFVETTLEPIAERMDAGADEALL